MCLAGFLRFGGDMSALNALGVLLASGGATAYGLLNAVNRPKQGVDSATLHAGQGVGKGDETGALLGSGASEQGP